MIIQIIRMKKTLHDIKDAQSDPLIFIAKQVFAILGVWIALILIAEVIILVLLGITGFSTGFGNPSGIARFFFWVFLVGFTGEIVLLIKIKQRIASYLRTAQGRAKEVIIDVVGE